MQLDYSFNVVKIRQTDELVVAVSPQEFLAMKLNVRMQMLLERRVEFYNGAQAVPQREALHALRVRAAAIAAGAAG